MSEPTYEPWWDKVAKIVEDEPLIPECKKVWPIKSKYYDNTDNYNIITNVGYFIGFIVLIHKYGGMLAV